MNAYQIADEMNKSSFHTGYALRAVSETKIEMGSEYQAMSFPSDFAVYEEGCYLAGVAGQAGANVEGCGIKFRYAGGQMVEICS